MRNVIFPINITVDGCCDHTKGEGTDEVHEYHGQLVRDSGVLAFGRKTYELMVPFWPEVAKNRSGETKAINDFAEAFDSVGEIVVFSRTLERVESKNTRVVRTDLGDEIRRLKQEPGKNILVGGVDVPSQLVKLGLVDEFYIFVQPMIVGEGRRLFDTLGLPAPLRLELADSKVFKSGSVALHYLKK